LPGRLQVDDVQAEIRQPDCSALSASVQTD